MKILNFNNGWKVYWGYVDKYCNAAKFPVIRTIISYFIVLRYIIIFLARKNIDRPRLHAACTSLSLQELLSSSNLLVSLRDGVYLCKLAAKIAPLEFVDHPSSDIEITGNIVSFIEACKTNGVEPFEISDLLSGSNMPLVVAVACELGEKVVAALERRAVQEVQTISVVFRIGYQLK
jgi:hypothetical protein